MQQIMNENYHQERSRLIQQHKEEVKAIEKEIKSKKGALKDQFKRRLEEVIKRQEEEFAKFEAKHGISTRKNPKEVKCEDLDDRMDGVLDPTLKNGKPILYEERKWNSLSKSELESECKLRGLSSKGSKEDLVTRLFIFTADQKSKLGKDTLGEDGIKAVRSEVRHTVSKNPYSKGFTVLSTANNICPPEINYSEAGGTGRKKGRFHNKKVDHRKNVRPDQRSWAAFCARNNIPRNGDSYEKTQKDSSSMGSDKEDKESDLSSNSSDDDSPNREANSGTYQNSQSEVEDDEVTERRNRRRAVMVKVLEKMFSSISLNEKNTGIELSKIEGHLTRLNVKNFRPELLGYSSVEDWVTSQSKNVLIYDKKKKRIFPPGSNTLSTSNNDEHYLTNYSSEDEKGSDDDYFM